MLARSSDFPLSQGRVEEALAGGGGKRMRCEGGEADAGVAGGGQE